MNGANRYIAPIERSISPQIITNTWPAAMIAYGAKNGSSVLKLAWVANRLLLIDEVERPRSP